MKKVIDGKLYNTETAEKLGGWWNGCGSNDFNYLSEDLYRTKSGKYFIHGDGGANSKYSQYCGNNSLCGMEKIIPIDSDDAIEWAENHLDADDYIKIFGEPEEA